MERASAFSGGGYDGSTSAFISRLMALCNEHESGVRRDRQRLEAQLAVAQERAEQAESANRARFAEVEALTSQVQRMSVQLDAATSGKDTRMARLETELVRTRFALHARLTQLQDVMYALQQVARDSLALRPALPASLGSDWEQALASVAHDVNTLRPVAGPALLACAEGGRDDLLQGILHPVTSAGEVDASTPTASDRKLAETGRASGSTGALAAQLHASSISDALTDALRRACRNGHASVVKSLIAAGAMPDARSSSDGLYQTALHVAAAGGHESILKLLFNCHTVSADEVDAYGRTALHWAAAGNHASAVRALLLQGADHQLCDVQGHTPSDVALSRPTPAPGYETNYFAASELLRTPVAKEVAAVLADAGLLFWNASMRANRHYNAKRFHAAIAAYTDAITHASSGKLPTAVRDLATLHYNRARALYRMGKHVAAIEDCTTALRHDASYRNALAQRAECYMSLFDFERAARDFQQLLESDATDRQWSRRLVDARAMRDLSYYGILGISKDADAATMKRAYRGLCLRWHPDKHASSPEDVARANAAFHRINEAYETLNDAYRRMMYDLEPRSMYGTALHGDASGRGASGTTASADGFDKWYAFELERDREREAEQAALRARDAEGKVRLTEAQEAARAVRKHLVARALGSMGAGAQRTGAASESADVKSTSHAVAAGAKASSRPAEGAQPPLLPSSSTSTKDSAEAARPTMPAPPPRIDSTLTGAATVAPHAVVPPRIASAIATDSAARQPTPVSVPAVNTPIAGGTPLPPLPSGGVSLPRTSPPVFLDTPVVDASVEASARTQTSTATPSFPPSAVTTAPAAGASKPVDASATASNAAPPPIAPSHVRGAKGGGSQAEELPSTPLDSDAKFDEVSAQVAATAARARAAVAKAEAFVKLVQTHARTTSADAGARHEGSGDGSEGEVRAHGAAPSVAGVRARSDQGRAPSGDETIDISDDEDDRGHLPSPRASGPTFTGAAASDTDAAAYYDHLFRMLGMAGAPQDGGGPVAAGVSARDGAFEVGVDDDDEHYDPAQYEAYLRDLSRLVHHYGADDQHTDSEEQDVSDEEGAGFHSDEEHNPRTTMPMSSYQHAVNAGDVDALHEAVRRALSRGAQLRGDASFAGPMHAHDGDATSEDDV